MVSKNTYTPEFKAKMVLKVLEGEEPLEMIASDNGLEPDMLRSWKEEFVRNSTAAFQQGTPREVCLAE